MIAASNRVEFVLQRNGAFRFFTHFVVIGATAGSLAAVSAYAMRPLPDTEPATRHQLSNAAAKSDRLAVAVQAALRSDLRPSFALAGIVPTAELQSFYDAVKPATEAASAPAAAYALQSAPPEGPTLASITSTPVELEAAPLPPPRPKRPPARSEGLLDDAQIAGIRTRLRLTSSQAEHWPAVEAALRDVARVHLNRGARRGGGTPNLDVNSPEVQRPAPAAARAVVDRVGRAAHVALPGVGAGLAAAAGLLLAAERAADLGARRADVDVGDAAVGAGGRHERSASRRSR
jgi:hypothetical protein